MECSREPHRPAELSPYAVACLEALAANGLGSAISVGGALGLLHYCDYRTTHDVDAWWSGAATAEEQQRVVATVEQVLAAFGQVRTRAWGDVVSVDLQQESRTVFSFQVARRSAQLEPTVPAPWTQVDLDSLPDLIASKMVALVERGAPRDFRDIYTLCETGVTSPSECWELWRRRQGLSGADADPERARLAVETHLERIAQHRPLDRIADLQERAQAERVRTWFAEELLNAVKD